jgi:intermediate cleaving peptidase 55
VLQSGDIDRINRILPSIFSDATAVYTDISSSESSGPAFLRSFPSLANGSGTFGKSLDPVKVKPLRPLLDNLRVFKSDAEIKNMRKAGQASGRAFTETMRRGFNKEKDLYAFLDYRFKANGSDAAAFVPVVAGGRV